MRFRTGILLAVLVPLLSGCATLRATLDGWEQGADGLSRPQRKLREALSGGDFTTALAWREDDALMRTLTSGITAFYAAQYARSAALMDTASLLADERVTTSVSKNGLSLLTNDNARSYEPRRTERLFVPYYGMLAYVELGQWEDAAVEARRLVGLLAQYGADRDDAERNLHASMHYLAGAVFERTGERNAAAVAYRNAHALVDRYPERAEQVGHGQGEVVVVAERGFVAHRTTESIHLVLGQEERDGLRGSDDSRRRVVDQLGERLALVKAPGVPSGFLQKSEAVAAPASPDRVGPSSSRIRHERSDDDDDDDGGHHLSLAFAALRRSPRPWAGAPRIRADSTIVDGLQQAASVDAASEVDERRERAALITRELARAAAKYAVTKAVHDKSGEAAGKLAEFGAAFLERADVRSWHLLPQELVTMRLHLPAGPHHLQLEVGDGANLRQVDFGMVNVKAGSILILPGRLWREPAPEGRSDCHHAGSRCDD